MTERKDFGDRRREKIGGYPLINGLSTAQGADGWRTKFPESVKSAAGHIRGDRAPMPETTGETRRTSGARLGVRTLPVQIACFRSSPGFPRLEPALMIVYRVMVEIPEIGAYPGDLVSVSPSGQLVVSRQSARDPS